MKRFLLLVMFAGAACLVRAQKVDSIFFHLYTDSLKKGTYNYINVDGKLSDGKWKPLSAKDIQFTSSACEFSGNELVVPADCKLEKVTVKAVLKSNPAIWKEVTIWVKKLPDPQVLPTREEVLNGKDNKGTEIKEVDLRTQFRAHQEEQKKLTQITPVANETQENLAEGSEAEPSKTETTEPDKIASICSETTIKISQLEAKVEKIQQKKDELKKRLQVSQLAREQLEQKLAQQETEQGSIAEPTEEGD